MNNKIRINPNIKYKIYGSSENMKEVYTKTSDIEQYRQKRSWEEIDEYLYKSVNLGKKFF